MQGAGGTGPVWEGLRQFGYLVGYLGSLAAAFTGAFLFMQAVGPAQDAAGNVAGPPAAAPAPAPALALALDRADVGVGVEERLRVRVLGEQGAPVGDLGDAALRMAVVRQDLASYHALTPEPDGAGAWTAVLNLPAPGPYRVVAEVAPPGRAPVVLGADLLAAGDYTPAALPLPAATAATRRYLVSMAGEPRPGSGSDLTFTVTDGGAPVTDLLPLSGAALGSAVALRAGDLAPARMTARSATPGGSVGGPAMVFGAAFPAAGTYRLFLDFQRAIGRRHTVAFTVVVPQTPPATREERT